MEDYTNQEFSKFSIPTKWGMIIGLVLVFITTIYGMFLMETLGMIGMAGMGFVSFVVSMLLLLYMAMQQRKAMGGFITFKEAFSAVFVSIIIIVLISNVYTYVYTNWIDTAYFDKLKNMSVDLAENFGGEKAGDAAALETDKQIAKQNTLSAQMLGLAGAIVLYSLFGFIIAAIVKRNKPEHLA